MDDEPGDNIVTIAAVGLLAYVSADISHHALGHAAACLALGGRVLSLSSIFVDCSLRGATIDLAGPCANLVIGLAAMIVAHGATRASSATRLFWILVAAFNLMWLEMQLVFSAATKTDDWAWAMHQFHIGEPVRYGMIAAGALAYVLTVRSTAVQMAPFAHPSSRARKIVLTAWLTAGAIAGATAAFDPHARAALLRHALPQSLLLSMGLLFLPARAAKVPFSGRQEATLAFSILWAIAAAIVGAASILFLGPGFSIAI